MPGGKLEFTAFRERRALVSRILAVMILAWVAAEIVSCTPAPAEQPGAAVTSPIAETPHSPASAAARGTKLSIRGVKPLNENERGESTPVTIRIFLLKDGAKFGQATVEEVWIHSKDLLGDDVAGMKEVAILPGTAQDVPLQIELGDSPPSVRFIGVLALFPKQDDQGPRKLVLARGELGSGLLLTGYHIVREK
jgi:type VI secretion system VasD/TssJ family lipoprotein